MEFGQKFLLQALAPFCRLPFPAKEGGVERGCVTFEFPGRFCRLFIISLASEERIPKQLKQVSFVGMKQFDINGLIGLPLMNNFNRQITTSVQFHYSVADPDPRLFLDPGQQDTGFFLV